MSGAGRDGMTLGELRGVGGGGGVGKVSSCLLCTVCVPVLSEGFLPWQLASVGLFSLELCVLLQYLLACPCLCPASKRPRLVTPRRLG